MGFKIKTDKLIAATRSGKKVFNLNENKNRSFSLRTYYTNFDIKYEDGNLTRQIELIAREEFKKFEGDKKWDPYQGGIPDDVQEKLTKRYKDIFELFVKHNDKISRVTFWGINDKYTWRNDNPINNRTDYPLLFDREYNEKPAYDALINLNN